MPDSTALELSKSLLDKHIPMPQIIFATAFDQYAVRAFEVNAVDYLLKPFDKKRVLQAVQKARERRNPAPRPTRLDTLVKMLAAQKPPADLQSTASRPRDGCS